MAGLPALLVLPRAGKSNSALRASPLGAMCNTCLNNCSLRVLDICCRLGIRHSCFITCSKQ